MPTTPLLLGVLLLFQSAVTPPAPTLSVDLRTAHDAVAPGEQITLAIAIRVSAPWHVYNPIILDSGFPTTIEFDLPAGVIVDNVRFPTPTFDSVGEGDASIEYLEHAGEFVVLAGLSADASLAPGGTLEIKAQVSALACIEQCIPVDASARLKLPVRASLGKEVDAAFFQKAREALPQGLADALYIKGSDLAIGNNRLKIGDETEIIATIRVKDGHHLQDRDPGVDSLIPSRLWIEARNGIEIAKESEQLWPKPHERDMPYVGKVREQSGVFKVRVPLKVSDPEFPSGPVELRVLFQYQCCSDQGQCFAPEMAAGVVRFEVDNPKVPLAAAVAGREEPAGGAAHDTAAVADLAETSDSSGATSTTAVRPADSANGGVVDSSVPTSLWVAMVFAFLGGLILNVMPCVLPVISIKVISFMQQGGEDHGRVLRLGLAFCAGIMVWFWAFGALAAQGQLPLQYPAVVLGVGTVLLLFALNMFGVFEVTLPGATVGKLDKLTSHEGYPGAFFKGLLATLLGTACTAPFLAGAVFYAGTQPMVNVMLVFTAAGLGMSFPYLLLASNPKWLVFVPKPGAWMNTFKQAMGFVLLGTVVWLLWVLGRQLDADGVVWTISFWGFVGLAAWLFGKVQWARTSTKRWTLSTIALASLVIGYWFSFEKMYDLRAALRGEFDTVVTGPTNIDAIVATVKERGWDDRIPWVHHRPGLAEELSLAGYTVYVDYTATWCTTCLANKAAVLETRRIRDLMRSLNAIPIEADFTKRDAGMLAEIQSFNRPSVPLNVIYPAGRPQDATVLPVVLSQAVVTAALEAAGPSSASLRLTAGVP